MPQVRRHIRIGLEKCELPIRVQKGDCALIGQEMRNPRAGRFTFKVDACLSGSSKPLCEQFAKQFTFRLVLYRFADADKNPLKRNELGSLMILPPIVVGDNLSWTEFRLSQVLDSSGTGQNFSIGRGLGVAIEVVKTADGILDFPARNARERTGSVALRIRSAALHFASRTIDDKVVV